MTKDELADYRDAIERRVDELIEWQFEHTPLIQKIINKRVEALTAQALEREKFFQGRLNVYLSPEDEDILRKAGEVIARILPSR